MNEKEIVETIQNYEPRSINTTLPIVWKSAKNDIVTDINGKKYIDFTSTIFVQNAGHSNARVKRYLHKAIDSNLLHTYMFPHELRAKFVSKLIDMTPDFCEKAFLLSSGTEATEAAVKLMRLYGNDAGKTKIVSFKGAMHGRTMAAELMKGTGIYESTDFINLPYPPTDNIFLWLNPKDIAGIMIESYRGWNAEFMPIKFIKNLFDFARKNVILIGFDEVQAGICRTGKLFAYEHYGVEPDLICIGKGIGGGMPLSAVLGRAKILDRPSVGDMSSTHSGNPLCCAAGLAVLEEIESKSLIQMAEKKGRRLAEKLHYMQTLNDSITDINTRGMVGAIVFKEGSEYMATKICVEAANRGLLLVHTGRNSVKIGPPITITEKNLITGCDILTKIVRGIRG
jgi:4-aminobutyrate aminotransferase-like enzyme